MDVGLAGNLKPNKDNALESFGYGFEKGGSDVTFIKQMVDASGSDFRSSLKERNMFKLADPEMQKYLLKSNIEMFEK